MIESVPGVEERILEVWVQPRPDYYLVRKFRVPLHQEFCLLLAWIYLTEEGWGDKKWVAGGLEEGAGVGRTGPRGRVLALGLAPLRLYSISAWNPVLLNGKAGPFQLCFLFVAIPMGCKMCWTCADLFSSESKVIRTFYRRSSS
jgi:hypothetical protein